LTEGLLASQGLCCLQSVSRTEINEGNESVTCGLQPCALIINLVSGILYEYKIRRQFFPPQNLFDFFTVYIKVWEDQKKM